MKTSRNTARKYALAESPPLRRISAASSMAASDAMAFA